MRSNDYQEVKMRHKPALFSLTSHICSNHTFKALLQAAAQPVALSHGRQSRRQTKREELQAAAPPVPHLTVNIAMPPQTAPVWLSQLLLPCLHG